MSKSPRADWAASVPVEGVIGLAAYIEGLIGAAPDISQVGGAGFLNGQVPVWSSALSKFRPGDISDIRGYEPPDPSETGTVINELNQPGVATKRYPPGYTFGPLENVWFQEIFDVKQYGAIGGGGEDDTDNVTHAIQDLNTNQGGVLFFPAGSYSLGIVETIQYPCLILGQGIGATVLNFNGTGFLGGQDGHFFGASDLTMMTSGTGGAETAFEISNGTSTGYSDPFIFRNLDLSGWSWNFLINTITRPGFISRCRLSATDFIADLTGDDFSITDCLFRSASTACIGIRCNGSRHKYTSNRFTGAVNYDRAVLVETGDRGSISDTLIVGTDSHGIELSNGSGGPDNWRVQNISFADISGEPVSFNRDKHYVNELQGLGGNTVTLYDSRRELVEEYTIDPGLLAPLQSITLDYSFTGAQPGDQIAIGAPYDMQGVITSSFVREADIISLTFFNTSGSSVDLGSGVYKLRIFN